MTAPAIIRFQRPRPQSTSGKPTGFRLSVQKLRNNWRLLRHWWLRPHTEYRPLFVIATHRSGSNLLIDYLNRQPGIGCHSEILCASLPFAPLGRRYSPRRAIRHIRLSLQTWRTPVRGCKLMLDQLASSRLTTDALTEAFPEARFVVLYRQSLAEQFLSLKTAAATNQWVLLPGQEARSAPKVHIDRIELRAWCDRTRDAYRRLLETPGLAERAVLLSYEDLVADPQYWLAEQICPLAGIEAGEAQTYLRKQNTQSLADRIENYREVEALLLSPHCRQTFYWPGRRQLLKRAA